ncbi:MAG: IMP dehydrogenase, partial [Elusimicrobiota bacterium]|nr:IMP dehydrogenase [Endomicrobiia bacterium]MDW8166299.1 IMP dehydrogenase [Elusimicrobiota bacterium]
MAFFIGRDKEARRAYGFDEVAIVPGNITIDPDDTDISVELCGFKLKVPLIASAMDGVVDPKMAVELGKFGALGVLNLDGIYTRYKDPYEQIEKIISASDEKATEIIQQIYKEPVKEDLIYQRIKEIKKENVLCAVSTVPQNAPKYI